MNKRSGFTLVEVLLVLAIIGIISAIVIPFLAGHRDSARQKSTEATAQAVTAECDSAAKAMTGATPAAVIAYVRALPNFTHPRCKNAYTPNISAVVAGTAAKDGDVGLLASTRADSSGATQQVILVSYKHQGTAAPLTSASVPVE